MKDSSSFVRKPRCKLPTNAKSLIKANLVRLSLTTNKAICAGWIILYAKFITKYLVCFENRANKIGCSNRNRTQNSDDCWWFSEGDNLTSDAFDTSKISCATLWFGNNKSVVNMWYADQFISLALNFLVDHIFLPRWGTHSSNPERFGRCFYTNKNDISIRHVAFNVRWDHQIATPALSKKLRQTRLNIKTRF